MITLNETLRGKDKKDINSIAKIEIQRINPSLLPLQQALERSSIVSDSPFTASILTFSEDNTHLTIKTAIFFTGIIAGCNCADDPSPVDEINEYCELLFIINKENANTIVKLLKDE